MEVSGVWRKLESRAIAKVRPGWVQKLYQRLTKMKSQNPELKIKPKSRGKTQNQGMSRFLTESETRVSQNTSKEACVRKNICLWQDKKTVGWA